MAFTKFCTVDDVKQFIPVHVDFTGHDDLLDKIIEIATQSVLKYCRRNFEKVAHTEVQSVLSNYNQVTGAVTPFIIWIAEPPIDIGQALTIKITSNRDWTNTTALTEIDDYIVNAADGSVQLFPRLWRHPHALQIVYTGGYSIDATDSDLLSVPFDILQATCLQSAFLFQRVKDAELGQKDEQTKAIPIKLFAGSAVQLIPEATKLLLDHRKVLLGGFG